MSRREWFLNGNYLIVFVSVCIILPLALMRQLGMFGFFLSLHFVLYSTFSIMYILTFMLVLIFCYLFLMLSSSRHRLPGLHQWFIPLLHGVFPDFGEFRRRL